MNLTIWSKGTYESIYVNGIRGFGGKCYFKKSRGKAELVTSGGDLSLEQKEDLYATLEMRYGIPRGEVLFETLKEAVASSTTPKKPRASKTRVGAMKSSSVERDASNLDILSIKIPDKIFVRIDHREPSELVEILSSHPNIEVVVDTLTLGDIIVNEAIVIERKDCTLRDQSSDFETSVIEQDKRLFNQSERLKMQEELLPIILIEGPVYESSKRMLVQQIDGAISFLAVIQKVSVWSTYNLNHTAYTIAKLGTHHRSGLGYDIALRAKKPEMLLDRKAFVLEGLPGISATIAKDLLAHFGSVKKVLMATEKELLKVKGLGKVKVAKILEVLE